MKIKYLFAIFFSIASFEVKAAWGDEGRQDYMTAAADLGISVADLTEIKQVNIPAWAESCSGIINEIAREACLDVVRAVDVKVRSALAYVADTLAVPFPNAHFNHFVLITDEADINGVGVNPNLPAGFGKRVVQHIILFEKMLEVCLEDLANAAEELSIASVINNNTPTIVQTSIRNRLATAMGKLSTAHISVGKYGTTAKTTMVTIGAIALGRFGGGPMQNGGGGNNAGGADGGGIAPNSTGGGSTAGGTTGGGSTSLGPLAFGMQNLLTPPVEAIIDFRDTYSASTYQFTSTLNNTWTSERKIFLTYAFTAEGTLPAMLAKNENGLWVQIPAGTEICLANYPSDKILYYSTPMNCVVLHTYRFSLETQMDGMPTVSLASCDNDMLRPNQSTTCTMGFNTTGVPPGGASFDKGFTVFQAKIIGRGGRIINQHVTVKLKTDVPNSCYSYNSSTGNWVWNSSCPFGGTTGGTTGSTTGGTTGGSNAGGGD